jgi:unsaturated chondroitin disaccharide hydrolase
MKLPCKHRGIASEQLERRLLMAASPLVLNGGTGNNSFYLRKDANAAQLDIWINAASPGVGTPTQTDLTSQITTVTVNGNGVSDTLTVDFTNGNPFPSTVTFTGGSGISNTMIVTGLGGTSVSINASAVTFGSTAINYNDTQFITINGSASNDTLTQTAQPNASLTFNGGAGNDTLNINGGTYLLAGDPAIATTNLTVNDKSSLFFAAGSAGMGINARHLAALNLSASATAVVDSPEAASDRAVLIVGSLSINATAQLDLGGNDLIVHNGSLTAITASLASAYSNGQWNGDGLASSAAHLDSTHLTALGVLQNNGGGNTPIYNTFDNQSVVTTDVLVKYTDYGDADLSGVVNAGDYLRIDSGFNSATSGWFNGSFNYGGAPNGDAYTLIDNAFNNQNTPVDPLKTKLENSLDVAQEQLQKTVAAVGISSNYPQYTNANGTWSWVPATQWTAGFFPGEMWELYQATGNPYYKTEATQFTNPLSVDDTDTSDVGFQVFDSFDPLLAQEPGNATIIQTMLKAAASKATQYNSTVGAFEAWRASTSGNPLANFNVLMDLIMDSNLLYWAAQQSGNQTYYNEALQNAVTEENYLVRADGGSAQFAYFNSANGQFIDNEAYEGYSATSTWSRGEAWGIYGFTMNYHATGRADFLTTAEKMANYYIANLPSDFVPYWDFNAPTIPNTYRDTSSAAVAASGLLQLSKVLASTDPTDSARYRTAAGEILNSLASPTYLANPANPGGGVLLQGALNVPANPSINNNSLIFGDYYFVEAINEYLAG